MTTVTEEQVRDFVAQTMNVAPADLDVTEELYDQGMNSLQLVTVLTWLQEQGYDLSFADLADDTRLTAWMALLNPSA